MSLQTLLQKIGTWIQGIFAKAGDEFENVILPAAIAVTNALKAAVDIDTPDLIGHLVGAAGVNLEDKVRTIIDSIVPKLQLAQTFKSLGNSNDILTAVLKLAATSDPDTQTAFWIEFSGMVSAAFADGNLTLAEGYTLAQAVYKHQHPAAAATTDEAPAE